MDRNKYEYKPMQDCFDLAKSEEWENVLSEEGCQDLCKKGCLGYQYFPLQCHIVEGTLPSISPTCREDETFAFRVERYPYQKMKNTCLLNEIYNAEENRIEDTEEYECLALCDAHPFCRYYLYGTDPVSTKLGLRECKLFRAQAHELDDCDCDNNLGVKYGKYCGLTAFVNGRTFVDQVTWFGEPESTYATLSGLSYQECASLCDALDNEYCSAFLHTWNYRRSSSAVQPQIFTKNRIIRADFRSGDDVALFLQLDDDGFGDKPSLIMSTAETSNDDALKSQQLSNEQTVGGNQAFLLKFWSKTGKCVTADEFSELPNGFTRGVIEDNFHQTPTCQLIIIGPCDNSNAIKFMEVNYLNLTNPGRFALSYDLPNTSAGNISVGCLGVQPEIAFYQERGDAFGDINIPSESNCTSVVSYNTCIKTTTERTHGNGIVLESTSSWDPPGCNLALIDSPVCTPGDSQRIS